MDEDAVGELVEGHLVAEEDVGYLHEVVVAWIITRLTVWADDAGGFVGASDGRFAVSAHRGRKPDTSVFLPGNTPPPFGLVRTPPDITIEVVSQTPRDGRRDRVEKMTDYAAFGVRWYWIVDPALRTFDVLELTAEGRYLHAIAASEGRVTSIPGCPGLAIDLDALWAKVDALNPLQ